MQQRIVIATDGSPAADAAVGVGLDVAAATRAGVRFVHAVSPLAEQLFAEYPMEGPPLEQVLANDRVLAAAVAQAEEKGVDAEVDLIGEFGDTADLAAAIAGIAAGIDASMIVVGSRGRGAVAGAVLGSVSHNLIRWATRPVLIVHAPEAS
jgi:nucleotide-binding universal stress UspA family protein